MKNQLEHIASLVLLGEINIAESYFCALKITQNAKEVDKEDESLFISLQLFFDKNEEAGGTIDNIKNILRSRSIDYLNSINTI